MTLTSGIRVINNSSHEIHVVLSQDLFFTVSVKKCLPDTVKITTTEKVVPIVATVVGSVAGAVALGGLAVLSLASLPFIGVGLGTGVTVGTGAAIGTGVTATSGIATTTALVGTGSGVAIGSGLAASSGVGVGTGVVVAQGIALGTAVATSTNVVAAGSVAVGGATAVTSAGIGIFNKVAKELKKTNEVTKKYGVYANGTNLNIEEVEGKFVIQKL